MAETQTHVFSSLHLVNHLLDQLKQDNYQKIDKKITEWCSTNETCLDEDSFNHLLCSLLSIYSQLRKLTHFHSLVLNITNPSTTNVSQSQLTSSLSGQFSREYGKCVSRLSASQLGELWKIICDAFNDTIVIHIQLLALLLAHLPLQDESLASQSYMRDQFGVLFELTKGLLVKSMGHLDVEKEFVSRDKTNVSASVVSSLLELYNVFASCHYQKMVYSQDKMDKLVEKWISSENNCVASSGSPRKKKRKSIGKGNWLDISLLLDLDLNNSEHADANKMLTHLLSSSDDYLSAKSRKAALKLLTLKVCCFH